MHPHYHLSLFPAFPREPTVFVAMSFAPDMRPRYDRVLAPAVERLAYEDDGTTFRAHRVDATVASDAVMDEVLQNISRCSLVLADITTVTVHNGRPLRNQNVLYEVGLAHAARQPAEVLLLRSDNDTLNFDLAGIRVHQYDPDGDADAAIQTVAELVKGCLEHVDRTKAAAVAKVASALDLPAWTILMNSWQQAPPRLPSSFGDIANQLYTNGAQARLLELGLFEAVYISQFDDKRSTPRAFRIDDSMTYRLTSFGSAVLAYGAQHLGLTAERLASWRAARESPGTAGA